MRSRVVAAVALLVMFMDVQPIAITADHGNAGQVFERTWARTDLPITTGEAERTWIWGPEPATEILHEPYSESDDGQRSVQYYDKARMEVTFTDTVQDSIWYVTNGLLVVELMTGRMQVGDNTFEQFAPAEENVAGDPTDPFGPTYWTMAQVSDEPASAVGDPINQRVTRSGVISIDESLSDQGIEVAVVVDQTGHSIADPLWDFMNSAGGVYVDGLLVEDQLFESPYFATGLPVTEPYWANVEVAGDTRLVLRQCFERRCLTYTPDNAPEWQVEAGNVGLHYYSWRYDTSPPVVPPADCAPGDGPDFSDQELTQPVFISQNLLCASFSSSTIAQGNFSEANLQLADFTGAELRQPVFRNTILDGALFIESQLDQPIFEGSIATNADFSAATLFQPIFTGANLQGAELGSADFVMPQFVNTICPDGSNSNEHGGTCLNNLDTEP